MKSEDILEDKRTRELGKLPLRDQHQISPPRLPVCGSERFMVLCMWVTLEIKVIDLAADSPPQSELQGNFHS